MKTLIKQIKIWWMLTLNASQIAFTSRFGALLFIIGKVLRFGFFFLFLLLIGERTTSIAGYSLWEIIFFFATFNLIDTLPQFFFREVYRFRYYIIRGDFDFILIKPLPALFRTLLGGSDVLDLVMLVMSLGFIFFSAQHMEGIAASGIFFYIVLILNALVISTAFHIFVLGLGLFSTAVDNTLWMYRDLTQLGRLPVDIYTEPLRGFITFIIPVGIMMTFPPKALLGVLSPQLVLISIAVAATFLLLSILFWKKALKNYTSASS